jgi:pimeloyl-ACP methyl ester carboxylesterase
MRSDHASNVARRGSDENCCAIPQPAWRYDGGGTNWGVSMAVERYVVFSHGKDSEPWGSKIAAMAEIARDEGFHVESVDYRGIDDPQARVTRLLAFCKDLRGQLVLVGSSMGGYVSVAGSSLLQARGMFLLAPALYMPGYEKFSPRPAMCPTTIVHGWRDEAIPVDNSIRFAREQKATLHIVDSDHRMLDQIRAINHFFAYFLYAIDEIH